MKIPISQIHENPNNPRHVFNQAEEDSLAASMQKQGQLVACVVKQIAPDSFQLISGALRRRAAIKNGWKDLECVIVDRSEGDEAIELMDYNNSKHLSWLEKYVGIEYASLKNPDMIQQELADRLGVSQKRISQALKSCQLLTKAARQAIFEASQVNDVDNYSDGIISGSWNLSELAFLAISDIATGKPDDKDLIERAVKVAIQAKMTEKQAKKLAEWVKNGRSPEDWKLGGTDGQKSDKTRQVYDPEDENAPYYRDGNLPEDGSIRVAKAE